MTCVLKQSVLSYAYVCDGVSLQANPQSLATGLASFLCRTLRFCLAFYLLGRPSHARPSTCHSPLCLCGSTYGGDARKHDRDHANCSSYPRTGESFEACAKASPDANWALCTFHADDYFAVVGWHADCRVVAQNRWTGIFYLGFCPRCCTILRTHSYPATALIILLL
jgi:hypothetical protein